MKSIKRTVIILTAALFLLLLSACSSETTDSDVDRTEKDSINTTNESSTNEGKNTDSSSKEDDPTAETTVENTDDLTPEPVSYLQVEGWQDDLYWGWDSNVGAIVVSSDGKQLFNVQDNRKLVTQGDRIFVGDYALIENNGVIDKNGKIVFELSETDYDKIYFTACMDVGYILVSKDVNTFEETGTHYYAINLKDGSARQFTDELIPIDIRNCSYEVDKTKQTWLYFGNGYFVYSPANWGFDTAHTIYNITDDSFYSGYKLDENGNRIERLPTLYFWDNFSIENNAIYFVSSDHTLYKYDLSTGYLSIVFDGSSFEDYNYFSWLEQAFFWSHGYKGETGYLINAETKQITPMTDYVSFTYLNGLNDGSYLVSVKNEGGGKFVTVVGADGQRKFDPISYTSVLDCNDNYFILKNDESTVVYNYAGSQIAVFPTDTVYKMGKSTVLYNETKETDGQNITCVMLLNTETGTVKEIDSQLIGSVKECTGYSENGYVVKNEKTFLLHEDGTVTYLTIS